MSNRRQAPVDLEPIERASRDELEVSRDGSLDQLTVNVEPHSSMLDQRPACEDAARELQQHIKSYIGVTASVALCVPGTVEPSVGKAKRVIDRRPRP